MPSLPQRLETATVRFWESGLPTLGEDLAAGVAFWQGFHAIKALAAMALLAAVTALGVAVWGGYARAEGRKRRVALLAAGILGAPIPVVVLLIAIANLQGAIVPLSSAISLLPIGDQSSASASAVAQIKDQLQVGSHSEPLMVLLNDFAAYHSTVAVLLLLACCALSAVTVALWVKRAKTSRTAVRLRRVLTAIPIALLPLIAGLALLAVANLETAADPVGPMLGFYLGGR